MDISRSSLLKIRELLELYKDRQYDFQLLFYIVKVLRNDVIFDNKILLAKTDRDIPAYVKTMEGVFCYTDKMKSFIENHIQNYRGMPSYNELEAYNYLFLEIIFHELTHLKQGNYAIEGKSKFQVLNELYYKVLLCGSRDESHYKSNPFQYVHEYNAQMEAFKLLRYLLPDNEFIKYLNDFQFARTFSNYYDSETKMFLVEKTLDAKNIKDKGIIQVHPLPVGIAVRNGLPVNEEVLSELMDTQMDMDKLSLVRSKYRI